MAISRMSSIIPVSPMAWFSDQKHRSTAKTNLPLWAKEQGYLTSKLICPTKYKIFQEHLFCSFHHNCLPLTRSSVAGNCTSSACANQKVKYSWFKPGSSSQYLVFVFVDHASSSTINNSNHGCPFRAAPHARQSPLERRQSLERPVTWMAPACAGTATGDLRSICRDMTSRNRCHLSDLRSICKNMTSRNRVMPWMLFHRLYPTNK